MSMYNEDYYERGIQTGVSCYENYRWMPEMTMAMAMVMIDYLDIPRGASVLDFGCAKGYLVKALRLLGRDAWGVDTSAYAINNSNGYCGPKMTGDFEYIIAKDVLEHLDISTLSDFLKTVKPNKIFAIIPLGDENGYTAPANDLDVTHRICRPTLWWCDFFEQNGWDVIKFTYRIDGIKDHYYERYPKAHGFFTLERDE